MANLTPEQANAMVQELRDASNALREALKTNPNDMTVINAYRNQVTEIRSRYGMDINPDHDHED